MLWERRHAGGDLHLVLNGLSSVATVNAVVFGPDAGMYHAEFSIGNKKRSRFDTLAQAQKWVLDQVNEIPYDEQPMVAGIRIYYVDEGFYVMPLPNGELVQHDHLGELKHMAKTYQTTVA